MSSPVSSPLQKIKNPFVQRRRSLPSVRTRTTTRASLSILVLLILTLGINEFRCHKYHCISRISFFSSDDSRGGYVGGGAIIHRPGEEMEGGVEVETVGYGEAENLETKSYQETLFIDDVDEHLENKIVENGSQVPNSEDQVLDIESSMTYIESGKKEDDERKSTTKNATGKVDKIGANSPIPALATQTSTSSPTTALLDAPAPITDLSLSTNSESSPHLNEDMEEQITWSGREDDPPLASHFVTPAGQEDPIRVPGNRASHANTHSLDGPTGTSPNFGAMEMGNLLGGAKAKA